MISKTILVLAITMWTLPSMASDLSCRAADEDNRNRMEVAVTVVAGSEIVEPVVTTYGDYELTVIYVTGDRFDSQSSVTMTANTFASRTYNVAGDNLLNLFGPGLILQCWFE